MVLLNLQAPRLGTDRLAPSESEGSIVAKHLRIQCISIVHTPLCKATLCNPLPRRGMGYGGKQEVDTPYMHLSINIVDRPCN